MEQSPATQSTSIQEILFRGGIDTSTWGTGSARTLDNLMREVESGESALTEEDGELLRTIHVLGIDVFCKIGDDTQRLREVRQEFTDGRERARNLATSIGEKLTLGEDEMIGIHRAVQEELGVNELLAVEHKGDVCREAFSTGYPGLLTRFHTSNYSVFIPVDQYHPEGYVETQSDKRTFFEWENVSGR